MRQAGYIARTGDSRDAYRVLVGRPDGKRPLGRPMCRWQDDITMDLQRSGMVRNGLDLYGSGWGQLGEALLNAVIILQVP